MSGLVESATAILSATERRLETVAENITNLSTPGFKRQISFTDLTSGVVPGAPSTPAPGLRSDLSQGRMSQTGNPFDLAVSGPGFFRLRAGDGYVYSRQGHFRLADDGTLVSPQGQVLQQAGGGDLVLEKGSVEVRTDGTVLDEGRPAGRIAVYVPNEGAEFEPLAGSTFTLPEASAEEAPGAQIRQGMIEASNVSLADEMIAMMGTMRQAETGARLIQLYDDLMGRAVTTFGQVGR
jgi:flagellar basal-body rod protein FlgF